MSTRFFSGAPLSDLTAQALRGQLCAQGESFEQMLTRVARALSLVEEDPPAWEARFRRALPALALNRNLYRAGESAAGEPPVLLDDFVLPIADDYRGEQGVQEVLMQSQQLLGAGCRLAYDCSTLRPHGAAGENEVAPSAVTCMRLLREVAIGKHLREVQLATLRVDHPDVEELLLRWEHKQLQGLCPSIIVTREFLDAVKDGTSFMLRHRAAPTTALAAARYIQLDAQGRYGYKRVGARELWQRIVRVAHGAFIDMQQLIYPPLIRDTGEGDTDDLGRARAPQILSTGAGVRLPAYAGVAVAQVNVAHFVLDPNSPQARFDRDGFAETVAVAVRLLDNALSLSRYPLPPLLESTRRHRPIALGLNGVALALAKLNLLSGSPQGNEQVLFWTRDFSEIAYHTSMELADEREPCLGFGPEQLFAMMYRVSLGLYQAIDERRLRNAVLLGMGAPWSSTLLFGDSVQLGADAGALLPAQDRAHMLCQVHQTLDDGLAPLIVQVGPHAQDLRVLYETFWAR